MAIESFPIFTDKIVNADLRKAALAAKDRGQRPAASKAYDTTVEAEWVLVSETLRIDGQPERTVLA